MNRPSEDDLMKLFEEERWRTADEESDCLLPEEVEQYCMSKDLPEARLDHLENCPECRGLIAASLPTDEEVRTFLSFIRRKIASSKVG